MVAAAFEQRATLPALVEQQFTDTTTSLAELVALPRGCDLGDGLDLFRACYPLHPITLLILPVLCQRVAQNERTLFSYLASSEPFGLAHRLQALHAGDWIGPWELCDYFLLNQTGAAADPITGHRWAECSTSSEAH